MEQMVRRKNEMNATKSATNPRDPFDDNNNETAAVADEDNPEGNGDVDDVEQEQDDNNNNLGADNEVIY